MPTTPQSPETLLTNAAAAPAGSLAETINVPEPTPLTTLNNAVPVAVTYFKLNFINMTPGTTITDMEQTARDFMSAFSFNKTAQVSNVPYNCLSVILAQDIYPTHVQAINLFFEGKGYFVANMVPYGPDNDMNRIYREVQ